MPPPRRLLASTATLPRHPTIAPPRCPQPPTRYSHTFKIGRRLKGKAQSRYLTEAQSQWLPRIVQSLFIQRAVDVQIPNGGDELVATASKDRTVRFWKAIRMPLALDIE
nr:hypothetical protein Iba_chr06cCG16020 [Ipomoea batatas]